MMKRRDFFMIQALLWLTLLIFAIGPAMAAKTVKPARHGTAAVTAPANVAVASPSLQPAQQVQAVQSLEDTLYAVRYDQEPIDSRLSRIETTVFGQSASGQPLDARISHLRSLLSVGALGPLSPTASKAASQQPAPQNNAYPQQNAANSPGQGPTNVYNNGSPTSPRNAPTTYGNGTATANAGPKDTTDYPVVGIMEQKVFSKTYTGEDVSQRLNRLELKVFNTPQSGALSDRVDNLRMVVLGDTGNGDVSPIVSNQGVYAPNAVGRPQGSSGYGNGNSYPTTPQQNNPNYGSQYNNGGSNYAPVAAAGQATPDTLAAMAEVEKQTLGHTYPSEPITARLDRVEMKIFKTTSPDLAPDERIQRVIAVASAGGAPATARTRTNTAFRTFLPIILTLLPLVLL